MTWFGNIRRKGFREPDKVERKNQRLFPLLCSENRVNHHHSYGNSVMGKLFYSKIHTSANNWLIFKMNNSRKQMINGQQNGVATDVICFLYMQQTEIMSNPFPSYSSMKRMVNAHRSFFFFFLLTSKLLTLIRMWIVELLQNKTDL